MDSIQKFLCANSKPKCSKPTSNDFGVEFSIRYSKLELFLSNSKSKFVVESKFPTILPKSYNLLESLFFIDFYQNLID
jgi:hypothetical protein